MATTSNFHILLNPITAHHNNVFYFHCNKTHSFYMWIEDMGVWCWKDSFFSASSEKSGIRECIARDVCLCHSAYIVFGCETPNLASTNDSYTYKRNDKITQFMRCRLFLPYMRPKTTRKYSSEKGDIIQNVQICAVHRADFIRQFYSSIVQTIFIFSRTVQWVYYICYTAYTIRLRQIW